MRGRIIRIDFCGMTKRIDIGKRIREWVSVKSGFWIKEIMLFNGTKRFMGFILHTWTEF